MTDWERRNNMQHPEEEYGKKILDMVQKLNKVIQDSGGTPPNTGEMKELIRTFTGEDLNLYGNQVIEMVQSLNIAVHQAGGAILSQNRLKELTTEQLIFLLASNDVRFVYKSNVTIAEEENLRKIIAKIPVPECVCKIPIETTNKLKELAGLSKKQKLETITCSKCKKINIVKDTTLYQTHWYVEPHGCIEGDYWEAGECGFICEHCSYMNRILFSKRENEELFSYDVKKLFKIIVNIHDDQQDEEDVKKITTGSINNYIVEKLLVTINYLTKEK